MRHGPVVRGSLAITVGLLLVALIASPVCAGPYFDTLTQPYGGTEYVSSSSRVCQGFYVGAVAPGSALGSVTLDMGASTSTGFLGVSIYADGGGTPGAWLTDLVGPAQPTVAGQYRYTPSGTFSVAAGTTYYAVANVFGGTPYYWTWTSDLNPALGSGDWGFNEGSGWNMYGFQPMRMRVEAVPEPGTAALMLGGMSVLGLALRRRRRAC